MVQVCLPAFLAQELPPLWLHLRIFLNIHYTSHWPHLLCLRKSNLVPNGLSQKAYTTSLPAVATKRLNYPLASKVMILK